MTPTSDTWRWLQSVNAGVAYPHDALGCSNPASWTWDKFFRAFLNERTKLRRRSGRRRHSGHDQRMSKKRVRSAREAGTLSFVDAVHYAAHELIDVKAIRMRFSGVLVVQILRPAFGHSIWPQRTARRDRFSEAAVLRRTIRPTRMETGTQNHEGIAGAAAAVDFLASLAGHGSKRERLATVFAELHERQHELTVQLWNGLTAIDGVTVYGPSPDHPRTSTVSSTVAGRSSHGRRPQTRRTSHICLRRRFLRHNRRRTPRRRRLGACRLCGATRRWMRLIGFLKVWPLYSPKFCWSAFSLPAWSFL